MLGKCFRCSSSCDGPRISPLAPQYECPRQSLLIITSSSENQQNRTEVLFHYSMHHYTGDEACFKHSNFFKVNVPAARDTRSKESRDGIPARRSGRAVTAARRTASLNPRSNYELFNCSNFNIRYWSWNYRGCWHQTCPPIDPR